jgi:hypothetical protein
MKSVVFNIKFSFFLSLTSASGTLNKEKQPYKDMTNQTNEPIEMEAGTVKYRETIKEGATTKQKNKSIESNHDR